MNLLISDKPQLLLDFFKGVHSAVTLQLIREKLVLSFLRTIPECSWTIDYYYYIYEAKVRTNLLSTLGNILFLFFKVPIVQHHVPLFR